MTENPKPKTDKSPSSRKVPAVPSSDPSPLLLTGGKEIRCIRSAKKLLGRLISAFIRGEIKGEDARTLTYMITAYVTICKDDDILQRIEQLEKKLSERK